MTPSTEGPAIPVRARQAFWDDATARQAHAALLRTVFESDPEAFAPPPSCRPFALFDQAGACVAALETFPLDLILDGRQISAAAIRSVAVHPDWRGRGLFRRLMAEALAWAGETIAGPALLYTGEPALYHRFGFHACPQHRVVGPPPIAIADAAAGSRRLRRGTPADDALLDRLLAGRAPVSTHVGVVGGRALLLAHLAQEPDLTVDYIASPEALILSEQDDDGVFTLVDVVAASIPPLASILRTLGLAPPRVDVLFPADRLAWSGMPRPEDTGLMIRGAPPAAFARPFMLPPTAGF